MIISRYSDLPADQAQPGGPVDRERIEAEKGPATHETKRELQVLEAVAIGHWSIRCHIDEGREPGASGRRVGAEPIAAERRLARIEEYDMGRHQGNRRTPSSALTASIQGECTSRIARSWGPRRNLDSLAR
jgi:hypothetical protein